MQLKKILFLLILIILMGFFYPLSATPPSPWEIEGLIGKKAPDFTLKDLSNNYVHLSSLRGKVVVLNFWATWCPPCRSEMPSLNSLYKDLKNKGLEIVAIATDRSVSKVRDYFSKNPLDIKILVDENNKVSRQFKVFSIPTTFLIDRNGIIIERFLGESDWTSSEVREKIINALLRGP